MLFNSQNQQVAILTLFLSQGAFRIRLNNFNVPLVYSVNHARLFDLDWKKFDRCRSVIPNRGNAI